MGGASRTPANAYSQIAPFDGDSSYFAPSTARFMLNLRVDDLDAFLVELRGKGIEILGTQSEPYGKFAWILDCDGIKIELWQQIGAARLGHPGLVPGSNRDAPSKSRLSRMTSPVTGAGLSVPHPFIGCFARQALTASIVPLTWPAGSIAE